MTAKLLGVNPTVASCYPHCWLCRAGNPGLHRWPVPGLGDATWVSAPESPCFSLCPYTPALCRAELWQWWGPSAPEEATKRLCLQGTAEVANTVTSSKGKESFFGGRTWHFLSQHEITQDKGHKLSASSPKYIPLKPHWSLLQNTEWNFNIQQYFDTSCYSNLLSFFHSCFCSLELLFKSSLFILLSTDLASSLDFYGLWGCRSVCAQN